MNCNIIGERNAVLYFKKIEREELDMPFIDSKIAGAVSNEQKETIKRRLGEAVSILGKSENFLMVGFSDNYDLYMGGEPLEKGVFVSVALFGNASSDAYNQMTKAICDIYAEEIGIPGDKVYVTYTGVKDWGWNGRNF